MERISKILSINLPKPYFIKSKGFTMIPNWFIESKDFSANEKIVAIVIAKHQRNRKHAWPSHSRIAEQTCCSSSTVKRAVRKLVNKGILTSIRSADYRSNIYRIKFVK